MSKSVSIYTALRLPTLEIEALTQGRMVVAMPQVFIHPGRQFALYPSDVLINLLTLEQYYRSNFLPLAQTVLASPSSERVLVKAWAKCELCRSFDNPESLNALSRLTMWTVEALKETFSKRSHILLAYLRVYSLPEPIEVPVSYEDQFVALPNPLIVPESSPVLSKSIFEQRKQQIVDLRPPLHPELEELQVAIARLAITNPAAESLNYRIQTFLGWASDQPAQQLDPDLSWIYTINDLGNAITGSNYEKGTAFEQIVHQSLAFLGFGLDYNAKGGAGGMDLYCTTPYPLVGECKSGQIIPDRAVEELDRIGKRHLGKETYEIAVKLIIGPGKPTKQLQESAAVSIISIINPMTLQKFVELQAKYPGSVNLIELKPYLEAGQIDYRIDEYIDNVQREIKLRSHLVQLVKNYLENTRFENVGVETLLGLYFGSKPPQPLAIQEMHEILIELSSPLTGYLGRDKGRDGQSDRFYFLRDLPD